MVRGGSSSSRLALVFLLLAAGCGPVHKQIRPQATEIRKVERLAVVFAGEGSFTVFDERARATQAPAAMFGLVGAAVAASYNQSEDNKSANALRTFIQNASCREHFQASFEQAIREAGKPAVEIVATRPDPKAGGFDAVLEFQIEHCGFRLTNQSTGEMAAFIELGAKLSLADGTRAWDDRETIVATTRAALATLKIQPDLARAQFEEVLTDAGRRMANNLIYP